MKKIEELNEPLVKQMCEALEASYKALYASQMFKFLDRDQYWKTPVLAELVKFYLANNKPQQLNG